MSQPARDLNGHIYQAFQSVQATVSITALTLVDFGFTQDEVDLAREMELHVNTTGIRYDTAGNAPTVSQGVQLLATDDQPLHIFARGDIKNFQLIRDNAADSEVYIILKR